MTLSRDQFARYELDGIADEYAELLVAGDLVTAAWAGCVRAVMLAPLPRPGRPGPVPRREVSSAVPGDG